MPTGAGKTWLAERAIEAALGGGRKAVYLTPLKALAEELSGRWRCAFPEHRVGVFTGDYGNGAAAYPVAFRDADLLVMTPERLDACTRTWRKHWSWLPAVDLLVVDELHLLGDARRGPRLEGALGRFRRLNPFARLLGLSATLGNRQELAAWLEGVSLVSTWRPVPLAWRVVRFRQVAEKPKLLLEEVSRTAEDGGNSLVFVHSRRRAEELSRWLLQSGLPAAHHHAGLTHAQRHEIEAGFRAAAGQTLIATATLELGLNLPVRKVVLYDLQAFDGQEFRPLPTNSVWQRVGRAGRPGFDSAGEAVLLAANWDRRAGAYADGDFEAIQSALARPGALAEQILAEVASGLSRTERQIAAAFAGSLAAKQGALSGVADAVDDMQEAGMIVRKPPSRDSAPTSPRLRVTRLGRIAAGRMLAPATVRRFRHILVSQACLTLFDLLLVVSASGDCEPVLPADFEELDTLAADLSREPAFLLANSPERLAAALDVEGKRLLAALKMALVLRDWTRRGDAEAVASARGCYAFEVTRLSEAARRLLQTMTAIAAIVREEAAPAQAEAAPVSAAMFERLQALTAMVAGGLDLLPASLTLIQGIGPRMARRFEQAGVSDLESLAAADAQRLAAIPGVSKQRAQRWIGAAVEMAPRRRATATLEEGQPTALPRCDWLRDWPGDVDPYRLRRAVELRVALDPQSEAAWIVSGGTEPHRVRSEQSRLICDCFDAARGRRCKHVLAIGVAQGDDKLVALARRLAEVHSRDAVDVWDLWREKS